MRCFYNDLIDYDGVVITASSEQALLPASNLANEQRTRVWRTGTSTAAESVVFDLLTAKAVTSVILLDHTLTASDTLIKVQGNSADSWGAPAFEQALTWASGTIAAVFASQTYRYWRIIFTKSAAGETRDIGRVFLGPYFEDTAEGPDYEGYEESTEDNSHKVKSISGQTYVDVQQPYCMLDLSFSGVTTTFAGNIKTMVEYVGQHKSFFLQVETSSPLNKVWYVKFDSAWGRKVMGVDSSYMWDLKGMKFEEQL